MITDVTRAAADGQPWGRDISVGAPVDEALAQQQQQSWGVDAPSNPPEAGQRPATLETAIAQLLAKTQGRHKGTAVNLELIQVG